MSDEGTPNETPDPTPQGEGGTTDPIRRERDELRVFKEHATKLMTGSGNESELEESMRFVMLNSGWSRSEVDDYIRSRSAQDEPTPTPETPPMAEGPIDPNTGSVFTPTPPQGERGGDQEVEELKKRLELLESRGDRNEVDVARKALGDVVRGTLDSNQGLRVLLDKAKEFRGDDGAETRSQFQQDLQGAILERVRARRAREGRFEMAWFEQEAEEAANQVVKRYRSVIGDPDKIQRAPETATGYDKLLKSEPVPLPKFEKGDDRGSVDAKVKSWTEDTLNRLVAESASGGKSRA